jgi:hypothetical protein
MKIVIDIKTDNAAFQDNDRELNQILTYAVEMICNYTGSFLRKDREGNLRDSNGNTVGKFKVTGK